MEKWEFGEGVLWKSNPTSDQNFKGDSQSNILLNFKFSSARWPNKINQLCRN